MVRVLGLLLALTWIGACVQLVRPVSDGSPPRGSRPAATTKSMVAVASAAARRQAPPEVRSTALRVDGRFDDWRESDQLAVLADSGELSALDVLRIDAANHKTDLFLGLHLAEAATLNHGDSRQGFPVLRLEVPGKGRLAIDFRRRRLLWRGQQISAYDVGLVVGPSYASKRVELRIDLHPLGVEVGTAVQIGIDGVRAPLAASFTLGSQGAPRPKPVPLGRPADGRLRLASLNCERAGLRDPRRRAPLERLIAAGAADIYVLQELGSMAASDVASAVAKATAGRQAWNIVMHGAGNILGTAILSRAKVLEVPTKSQRLVGGVVLSNPAVVVFGVHLKCCGFPGSKEDRQRLAQVEHLRVVIERFVQGRLGAALRPYRNAAVLVVGDFNDVGSAMLQQRMRGSPNKRPALKQWLLPHIDGLSVHTWFDKQATFTPSTLDLLFHGPQLSPRRGYVLDTRRLSAEQLSVLKLRQMDSAASDHLLLVADF